MTPLDEQMKRWERLGYESFLVEQKEKADQALDNFEGLEEMPPPDPSQPRFQPSEDWFVYGTDTPQYEEDEDVPPTDTAQAADGHARLSGCGYT